MESLSERLERLNPGGISFVTPEEDDMMLMNTMKLAAKRAGERMGMKKGIKKGLKKGIEQGIEQGIAQGIEQGIEQGFERGTMESQKQIVENMLKVGVPLDDIVKYTNININLIKNIKKKMNI